LTPDAGEYSVHNDLAAVFVTYAADLCAALIRICTIGFSSGEQVVPVHRMVAKLGVGLRNQVGSDGDGVLHLDSLESCAVVIQDLYVSDRPRPRVSGGFN